MSKQVDRTTSQTELLRRLALHPAELARFCLQRDIAELAVFGSALSEHFRPDSDIDLLVTFTPGARPGLLDHVRIEQELAALLGRPVDLVSKQAVVRGANAIRRKHILESAQVIYSQAHSAHAA